MEIVIRPQQKARIDWKELWSYRELFYYFVWRDIKVRYKQTAIGLAWAIFQPFIMMVVFTLFFNKVAGIESGAIPYAIFSYTGLLFWNYFSQTLSRSSESLVASQGMITKVYFPRIILPFSATFLGLLDFFFAFLVFGGLMIYFQIVPSLVGVLIFLPMLLLTFVAASGAGMFLAALNVKYRDVRQALPFFIQMLLFLTPVIYPIALVPHRFQWLLYFNPMTGVITTVRATLLHDGQVQVGLLMISIASSLLLFLGGLSFFKKRERRIADIV